MIHLTTFGGCSLTGANGVPLAVAQRRALALLAAIASSGNAGLSRERAAALFWPDADPARARRSLAQAVYHLRRVAGRDDLFIDTLELRLDPAVIRSDRADFDTALAAGRLVEAASLYRGPFLDGFVVPGADAFERWLEGERRHLQQRCAEVLRSLSTRARADGDHASEVAWCRRRVALDALDSEAALALVDALIADGEFSGALRTIRIHEALITEELDLALPPGFRERVERIRELSSEATTVVEASPQPRSSAGPSELPVKPHRDLVIPRLASRRRATPLMLRTAGWTVVVAVLVGIGAALGRLTAPTPAPIVATSTSSIADGVVAILPFAVDGALHSSSIGTEIAARLTRTFPGDVGPRALDPSLMLDAVRQQENAEAVMRTRQLARSLAEGLGAAEVVIGRVSGTAATFEVSAVLLDVRTGAERASVEVDGTRADLQAAANRLAAGLLVERELDTERARAFAGVDLSVLRSFLRAERAFRSERHEEAVRLYARALEQDSTFAPAALGLATAADRFNGAEQNDEGLALAWVARDRLGEQDRAFLLAFVGPRYPELSPGEEQVQAWERAVTIAGDRAEVWVDLGERYFYEGSAIGVRHARTRAAAAFRRALKRDPHNSSAVRHLIEIAAQDGDTTELADLGAEARIERAGGLVADYLRWTVAGMRRDTVALDRLRLRFNSMDAPSLRAIAMSALHGVGSIADGERALRLLAERSPLGSERLDILLARHSYALNAGQRANALGITDEIEDVVPASHPHLRLRVLDALYSQGDTAAAIAAAQELALVADRPLALGAAERSLQLADACVLSQWRVRRERTPLAISSARHAVTQLRAAGLPRILVPVGANPHACADLVDAMIAVATAAPDAAARVTRIESMTLAGPALNDARAWAPIAVARLAEEVGDRPRALSAVRRRGYLNGWPRYLSTAIELEERLGKRNGLVGGRAAGAGHD